MDMLVEGDIKAIYFKRVDEDVVAKNKKPKYTDIEMEEFSNQLEDLFK